MFNKLILLVLIFSFYSNATISTSESVQLYYAPNSSKQYKMRTKFTKETNFYVLKDMIKSNGKSWQLVRVIGHNKSNPTIGFKLMSNKILKERKDQSGLKSSNHCNKEIEEITYTIKEGNEQIQATKGYSGSSYSEFNKCDDSIYNPILAGNNKQKQQLKLKFHKSCEILKDPVTQNNDENVNKLQNCLNNLIQVGMSGAKVKGAKFVIKNKHGEIIRSRQALSPKIFFNNLFDKLNVKERNFLARIITSIGEAGTITNYYRKYDTDKKPHLQEMMAINMVLENRVAEVKEINEKHKELKEKAQEIYPTLSDKKLIEQLKSDVKGISRAMYHAKQEKSLVKKIRKHFSDMISGVENYRPELSNVSSLDMAIDAKGYAFSMYSKIYKKISRYKTYNYPSWYKVISKDAEDYHDNALRAYILFNKAMLEGKYSKGVTHYYSTCYKKPEFSIVSKAKRRYPKLVDIAFKIDGKMRYTITHKKFTSKRGIHSPFSCNRILTPKQRRLKNRTGHCFYSNVLWKYYGHNFGSKR